jgi:hypothetical protein
VVTYIIEGDGGKEILVLVVAGASPDVTNLLGLDVDNLKGLAGQRRCRNLEDRQRRSQVCQRLSDTRDGWDQRREAELSLLERAGRAAGDTGNQGAQESGSEG